MLGKDLRLSHLGPDAPFFFAKGTAILPLTQGGTRRIILSEREYVDLASQTMKSNARIGLLKERTCALRIGTRQEDRPWRRQ